MTNGSLIKDSYTCIKQPLKIDKAKILMTNGILMKVESIAESSKGSILQYFWPALSNNWSWKPIFWSFWEWLFYTGFTVHVIMWDTYNSSSTKFPSVKLWIICHSSFNLKLVLGAQKNSVIVMVLLCTYNICFALEIRISSTSI